MTLPLSLNQPVRCRIVCHTPQAFSQISVNTIAYQVLSLGASAITDQDVATQLDSLISSQYHNLLSANAEYRGVSAQALNMTAPYHAQGGVVFQNVNAGNGLVAGNMVPTQVSGLISFITPLAGPRHRGRLYIPFPGTSDDGGQSTPTAGYVTKLSALANLFLANLVVSQGGRTGTLIPVIMHRLPKVGAIEVPTPIIKVTVSARWATQRKRGTFGRPNAIPF